ncbi:hypothetical protein [Priestia filamentosa]|uniref:hypothetical protein n=1 Tax=Priestia filamentosa TaxID=1402861 RepID=UPI0005891E7E|nr:hypothetical protein [Priestia filamentosa]RJS63720.1 hypothetical protein CJ485_02850 [Priestia filamentosa]WCM14137.1 hypothetical protein PGN40_12315 [Priestia filamentosa]
MTKKGLESIFWSIALPGFPQLMNRKLVKGILFIGLEILINVQSNFNTVIILSFQGEIEKAIEQTNYQWLMFYPCLYFFAMWDAYRDVEDEHSPFMFIPFVFSAYFVTVGVIYSSTFTIKNILLGPIWLSFLCLPIGLLVGMTIKKIILWKIEHSSS